MNDVTSIWCPNCGGEIEIDWENHTYSHKRREIAVCAADDNIYLAELEFGCTEGEDKNGIRE